jgi:hypothetical protein
VSVGVARVDCDLVPHACSCPETSLSIEDGRWHKPSPFFHNGWVLSPSYFMDFRENEILEGNAVKK